LACERFCSTIRFNRKKAKTVAIVYAENLIGLDRPVGTMRTRSRSALVLVLTAKGRSPLQEGTSQLSKIVAMV
jgi:hypothetical protein